MLIIAAHDVGLSTLILSLGLHYPFNFFALGLTRDLFGIYSVVETRDLRIEVALSW